VKRLFGTDGIRGVAGSSPLDPPTVRRFGAALAAVTCERHADRPCRVVLGRDTRESGPWLRDAVIEGLVAAGGTAVDAGVISTPGLAWIVAHEDFDAGVMISASHNPFADNGLKVFDHSGFKLSDDLERRVEALILDGHALPARAGGGHRTDEGLTRRYVEHLSRLLPQGGRLSGLTITLDCANGSACRIAPEVFRGHGAVVAVTGCAPDGRNINLDCGSLHLDALAREVRRQGSDLGIAFDGDADRALAVDRRGRVADGDHILYLTGLRLQREGRLGGGAVVATIMSNLWLEQRLAAEGLTLHRAPVGDKYVLDRMIAEGAMLGGEQSGHVIFREHATTGDGILTGLLLADTLVEQGLTLDRLLDSIQPFPQVHKTIRVRHKPDLRVHARVGPAVAAVEQALSGSGRVVLRYSGTEPVARVMVEGPDAAAVAAHAERLAALIERELGG